jgi:hypothetical protein
MLPEGVTNQLIASRHLYYLAEQNIRSQQTSSLFAGINLLQDAVEAFLWAAATYKHCAAGRDRVEIHQLLDGVNNAISPHSLPFRQTITQSKQTANKRSTMVFILIERKQNASWLVWVNS